MRRETGGSSLDGAAHLPHRDASHCGAGAEGSAGLLPQPSVASRPQTAAPAVGPEGLLAAKQQLLRGLEEGEARPSDAFEAAIREVPEAGASSGPSGSSKTALPSLPDPPGAIRAARPSTAQPRSPTAAGGPSPRRGSLPL